MGHSVSMDGRWKGNGMSGDGGGSLGTFVHVNDCHDLRSGFLFRECACCIPCGFILLCWICRGGGFCWDFLRWCVVIIVHWSSLEEGVYFL